MTKEVVIQKAYGKHWETVKDIIDENGWCSKRKKINFEVMKKDFDIAYDNYDSYTFRPKSLNGLENNNGWFKIEDKAQRNTANTIDIVFTDKGNIYSYATYNNFASIYEIEKITHFMQTQKPNPPVY